MALTLRATHADRPFLAYDLSVLPSHLQPITVVDADRLALDHITNLYADTSPTCAPSSTSTDNDTSPPCRTPGLLAVRGKVPVYLGQPLAILIFENAATYRAAKRLLQFNTNVVSYGDPVDLPSATVPYDPPTYLTRYADRFSQVLVGKTNPYATPPPPPPTTAAPRAAPHTDEFARISGAW